MRGMTEFACPVCATPYEPGARTCAFCGVSLLEPEPASPAQSPSLSDAEVAAEIAAETDAPIDIEPDTERSADAAPSAEVAVDDADAPQAGPAETEAAAHVAADPSSAQGADADADADAMATPPDPDGKSPDAPAIPAPDVVRADAAPPPGHAPSFAHPPTAASVAQRRQQRIEWGLVGALAALLLVQVVASDFQQLAAGDATRPWLQRACTVLHCALPPWREPQALRLLQRDVRANPAHPGLLRISASVRNEARWPQPWPRLRITLADADGRAIAARDFAAREYLGATPTTNGIGSGQVAGIAFDVVDPSPRVTAFTFEFR